MKNEVDQLIFQTDKTLDEVKDNKAVGEDEVQKIKDARDELKKAQEANNVDDMKTKKDDLTKLVQDMSVKLYQQAQDAQKAQDGAADNSSSDNNGSNDDGTVNGDFKEVDPDDKN